MLVDAFKTSMTKISELLSEASELVYDINMEAEGGAPAAIPAEPKRRGRKPKAADDAVATAPELPWGASGGTTDDEEDEEGEEDDDWDEDEESDDRDDEDDDEETDDDDIDPDDDVPLSVIQQTAAAPSVECSTCQHFDAAHTYCRRFQAVPPPNILASGCEAWAVNPILVAVPPAQTTPPTPWGMQPTLAPGKPPVAAEVPEDKPRRRRARNGAAPQPPEPAVAARRGRPRKQEVTPVAAKGRVSKDLPF